MRTISSGALTKLATDEGMEPYNVIGVQWVKGGPITYYSDKDALGIKGKIVRIDSFDEALQISSGSASTEVAVTLDDTDGSIKAIMDSHDIHLRSAYIYQLFEGLAFEDKFVLFQGQISSPLTWKEADRTVSFNIVSQLQDQEVGFSPEMGQFPNIPQDLIGKPWPMCFGTPVDVPATAITEVARGTLADGTGIHDFTIPAEISCLEQQKDFCVAMAQIWFISAAILIADGDEQGGNAALATGTQFLNQSINIEAQATDLRKALAQQIAFEITPIRILNGDKFPQNKTVTLDVNGAKLSGQFDGDIFHISHREHPQFHLYQPHTELQPDPDHPGHFKEVEVAGKKLPFLPDSFLAEGNGEKIFIPGDRIEGDQAGFFWAEAGSSVVIAGDNPQDFVASITPGTVLRVAAYGAFNGVRTLLTLPSRYYEIKHVDYNMPTGYVTVIRLIQPLSTITLSDGITSAGWEDGIFVTFQSDMGSNTVDQIAYILTLYEDFEIDTTSFNHVHTLIANYPSNWALLDVQNIIDLLQAIARQARCGLWISEGKVFIRYLSEDPTTVLDIAEDDINAPDGHSTMTIFHTPTEDLVTKYIATWRVSYAITDLNSVILRNNISKYGVLPAPSGRTEEYFIYNREDLVIKSATFWIIRMSNTWKKMSFQTKIHTLAAEALDAVNLNFARHWVANVAVKGIVDSAPLDTDNRTIDFTVWTPVRAGEMLPYDFVHPADIEATLIYPTQQEIAAGNAGGGSPFQNAGHNTHGTTTGGGFLGCDPQFDVGCGRPRTLGDRRPSDRNQTGPGPSVFPPGNSGPDQGNPGINTPPYKQNPFPNDPAINHIEIHKTPIYDSVTQQHTTLDKLIKEIRSTGSTVTVGPTIGSTVTTSNGEIYIVDKPHVSDGKNRGTMEFKWDSNAFAAARAFLKPNPGS